VTAVHGRMILFQVQPSLVITSARPERCFEDVLKVWYLLSEAYAIIKHPKNIPFFLLDARIPYTRACTDLYKITQNLFAYKKNLENNSGSPSSPTILDINIFT
jgi:hypothetical protein